MKLIRWDKSIITTADIEHRAVRADQRNSSGDKRNISRSRGVVKNSADTPRSYLVETPQGVLRRNRQMHVVLPEDDNTPRTNMPVNDTDPHTESHVVQEPECSHVPAPSNVTITRSGRTSRPPDRLTCCIIKHLACIKLVILSPRVLLVRGCGFVSLPYCSVCRCASVCQALFCLWRDVVWSVPYECCLIVLLINYACGVNALRKRILLVSRLLPSFRWSFAVNTTAVY